MRKQHVASPKRPVRRALGDPPDPPDIGGHAQRVFEPSMTPHEAETGMTGYSLLPISENGSTNDRFRGGRSASMLVAVPPGCGINCHTSTGLALVAARQRGLAGYGKAKPTGSNTTGCLLDR
jgi:hypothetical protein